jgi:hypothetical protein
MYEKRLRALLLCNLWDEFGPGRMISYLASVGDITNTLVVVVILFALPAIAVARINNLPDGGVLSVRSLLFPFLLSLLCLAPLRAEADEAAGRVLILDKSLERMVQPGGGLLLSVTLRNTNPFTVVAVAVICTPAGDPNFVITMIVPGYIAAGADLKATVGYIPSEITAAPVTCSVAAALHPGALQPPTPTVNPVANLYLRNLSANHVHSTGDLVISLTILQRQ